MKPEDFEKLFDAYVDGLLKGELLERFEAHVRKHPALVERLRVHRAIDKSLREGLAPTIDAERIGAMLAAADRPAKRFVTPRRMLLAACAGLVVIGAASVVFLRQPAAPTQTGFMPRKVAFAEPAQVYRDLEAAGFKPDWVCADEAQFAEYTMGQFEESFLMRPEDGVALIGWVKVPVFSSYTGEMMADVNGQKAILIVDRVNDDRTLEDPSGEGLHLFRRTLGNLVMYEITPGESPALLPLAHQPGTP